MIKMFEYSVRGATFEIMYNESINRFDFGKCHNSVDLPNVKTIASSVIRELNDHLIQGSSYKKLNFMVGFENNDNSFKVIIRDHTKPKDFSIAVLDKEIVFNDNGRLVVVGIGVEARKLIDQLTDLYQSHLACAISTI